MHNLVVELIVALIARRLERADRWPLLQPESHWRLTGRNESGSPPLTLSGSRLFFAARGHHERGRQPAQAEPRRPTWLAWRRGEGYCGRAMTLCYARLRGEGCREWTAARPLSSSTRTVRGPRIQKRNAETRFAFPLQSSIITQPWCHFTSGTGENGLGKRKGKGTIWATSLKIPLSAYLSHTPDLKNDCAPMGSFFYLFI